MAIVQKIAQFIISIFKFHKLKIVFVILSSFIFVVIIFPYDDLSDLFVEKVAQATNNQVFFQFEKLDLSLIPKPSVDLKDVSIQISQLQELKAGRLTIAPSILSLLSFKPGAVVKAKDLFSGDVTAVLAQGGKTEAGVSKQSISIDADELQVSELKSFLKSPIPIEGLLTMALEATIDPSFGEQPNGEFEVDSNKLVLVESNLPTPAGELAFPRMEFSGVRIRGRLIGSELVVEEALLGNDKDNLAIRFKGKFAVTFRKAGTKVIPIFNKYDVRAEIKSKPNTDKTLDLLLGFLDKYKKPAGKKNIYLLRVSAPRFQAKARMVAISSFE